MKNILDDGNLQAGEVSLIKAKPGAGKSNAIKVLDVPSVDRQVQVYKIIEEQINIHDLTVVRLTNKIDIDLYKNQLQAKGYKVEVGSIDGEFGDAILTIYKLEADTNYKNKCIIYANMMGSDCDLDAINQFMDNTFETCLVLMCGDYEKPIMSFSDIYRLERKICEDKLKEASIHFSHMANYVKSIYTKEQIINAVWLDAEDRNDKSLASYCITLDENDNLILDEFKLIARANRKYNEMLHHRPDVLEKH